MLREQRAVDERRLLDIVPVAGRCDESDAEVVRALCQVAVRVGRAQTPVARVVVASVVHVHRDMLRLVLLHCHGEVIAPILLAREVCRQLRGIHVVDELELSGELRHIDLALTQHRHHAADHALTPLLVARERHAGDIQQGGRPQAEARGNHEGQSFSPHKHLHPLSTSIPHVENCCTTERLLICTKEAS